eukprot:1807236-Prorocentrum_lima.AAC.1
MIRPGDDLWHSTKASKTPIVYRRDTKQVVAASAPAMDVVPGAAVEAAEPPDAEMDVSATGIAASDHPDPKPGMAVFQRVQ